MGGNSLMYENHKLCDSLKPSEICLVVEQYTEGIYIRKFHEHVPKHRLSNSARTNLLRTLVLHFSGASAEAIVSSSLNKRGRSPPAMTFQWATSYPEPGVLRFYWGTDTIAWSDQVIVPEKFRAAD